jgi:hypothetical protein
MCVFLLTPLPLQPFYPRYVIYATIPMSLLAALAMVRLWKHVAISSRIGRYLAGSAALLLIVAPSLWQDGAVIKDPRQLPLLPIDRLQYLADYPAGYALDRIVQEMHQALGDLHVVLLSSAVNAVTCELQVIEHGDPRTRVLSVDFRHLSMATIREEKGDRIYLVLTRPYWQWINPRDLHATLAFSSFTQDGSAIYLYRISSV